MKEYTEEEVRLIIEGAIAEEREACANVCESVSPFGSHLALQKATIEDCAEAIRARGAA